jgi:hypothetical protein
MLLVTFAVAQQKEQRYQIEKLGTIDGFDLTILLDTQTGKSWQLVSDSVVVEKTISTVEYKKYFVWKNILFQPNVNAVIPRYRTLPDSSIAKK